MSNSQELNRTDNNYISNNLVTCQYFNVIHSYGIWHHNPLQSTTPVLLLQMVVIFLSTRAIYFLLRPFHQTTVMAQILGGAIIGPSILGDDTSTLFPMRSRHILRTFAEFGMILHIFVLGVQIDLGLIKHIRRRAVAIGFFGSLIPLIFGMSSFRLIQQQKSRFDVESATGIAASVAANSMTSLVVVTSVLKELNMLNSELGRLASSAAMVSDILSWITCMILNGVSDAYNSNPMKPLYTFPSLFGFYCTMFFLLRPLTIWIVSKTAEGESMKQSHFISIICIVLGVGFVGTCFGQGSFLGCFVFGLCLPDGPPLGTQLVNKLDFFISGFLIPVFCAMSGIRWEMYLLKESSTRKMELIMVMSYIGKFTGVILSSSFFGISFIKASCLAFIMCCRGIPEIAMYCMWKDKKIITSQIFALLIANMVIVTSIASAVVGYLYDPSRRYKLDVRRAISKTKQNNLRILVCINKEENMNPIISLLEASNPTRNFPITAFVLQLIELKGSVTAFLKPYHQHTQSVVASSTHLINAFAQLERSYHGNIVVQHFTTIAPYASMHDDVCTLALDKRAVIIIVPFHKQWGVNCLVESSELPIRALNGNILDKAPCSVGVLVQRGKIKSIRPTFDFQLSYHIVMLFVGGADDREALAYSRLMVEHPNISLTVVWFVSSDPDTSSGIETTDDRDLDNHAFDEFKDSVVTKKITLRVEIVKDGIGTTRVIQTLTENFDLFIVGKNHDPCSKVTLGLSEWIEYPELGIIGDTLVNSSEEFSVLVVQQQPQEIRHKSKAFTKS